MKIMKNKSLALILSFLFLFPVFVSVAEEPATIDIDNDKANIALLFVNNSKSKYDDEIDKKMMSNFDALLKNDFNIIPGQEYLRRLSENGMEDIATAERTDIVEVFKGENIDYVIFVEIQPFIRKEKFTFFTQGMDMTAIVPMKIIDLANNKYLYNGKFTELASSSTVFGSVGNKSVSLKALDNVILKMNPVIQTRLPMDKQPATTDNSVKKDHTSQPGTKNPK